VDVQLCDTLRVAQNINWSTAQDIDQIINEDVHINKYNRWTTVNQTIKESLCMDKENTWIVEQSVKENTWIVEQSVKENTWIVEQQIDPCSNDDYEIKLTFSKKSNTQIDQVFEEINEIKQIINESNKLLNEQDLFNNFNKYSEPKTFQTIISNNKINIVQHKSNTAQQVFTQQNTIQHKSNTAQQISTQSNIVQHKPNINQQTSNIVQHKSNINQQTSTQSNINQQTSTQSNINQYKSNIAQQISTQSNINQHKPNTVQQTSTQQNKVSEQLIDNSTMIVCRQTLKVYDEYCPINLNVLKNFEPIIDSKYEGNFECGYFSGLGKITFKSGSSYTGNFFRNKFHGYGTFIHFCGDIYIGMWH